MVSTFGTTDEGAYAPGVETMKKPFGASVSLWRDMEPATLPDGRKVEGRAQLRGLGLKEEPSRREVEEARRAYQPAPKAWTFDLWRVVLRVHVPNGRGAAGAVPAYVPRYFACDYRTGLGHRVEPVRVTSWGQAVFGENPKRVRQTWGRVTNDVRDIIAAAVPTAPDVSGVLVCNLLDAAGTDGQTFAGWAEEYGYSEDSIKAREAFDVCRDVAAILPRFLGVPLGECAELSQALEDAECERGRAAREAQRKAEEAREAARATREGGAS